MVERRLSLEPEVQEIFTGIDEKRNFLLSGGAGSGKTYSLVNVIRQVIAENPTSKVACMTYTNAAVKEIEHRVNHKNLNVTTIHDFLWENIKHFQKELKGGLISLINNPDIKSLSIEDINPIPDDFYDDLLEGIRYREYVKLLHGIISHDELLILANYLFDKYPKLSSIVKDKYPFIFIDEYQDTNILVIDIFLKHFKKSSNKNIIGFFGDAMQSIYDDGVGNLDEYKGIDVDSVKEIKKVQNRRNPQKVINLSNKLRTDGIIQVPSIQDQNAPNIFNGEVREGNIQFLYSNNEDVQKIRNYLTENFGWDFSDSKETKELNLTHNLIAGKAGFRELMDIYDKDPVVKLKNDILEKIKSNREKGKPEIEFSEDDSFDEVVDKFQLKNKQRELKKNLILSDPFNVLLYNQLKDKPFSEVRKIYVNKDALIDDKKQEKDDENKKGSKRDNLIKHLFKIQTIINHYQNRNYNEFLKTTDYRVNITSIESKRILKENIESLINVGEKTIEEIIIEADEKAICLIDDKLNEFKGKSEYLYNRVKGVSFNEFQKMFEYLEGNTPFSTQHKIKGAEFNNVLVILDNGGWDKYNFTNMFLGLGTATVLERTQKIFYVCSTRAKESLVVFFHNPSPQIISKAKEWFGEENTVELI